MAQPLWIGVSILTILSTPTIGYGNAATRATTERTDGGVGDGRRVGIPACIEQTAAVNVRQDVAALAQMTGNGLPRPAGNRPAALANQSDPLAITIRVRDTAQVPDDVLSSAREHVSRIYREAGVDALWSTPEALSAQSTAVRQAALTIAILTQHQAERLDSEITGDRVGFTARIADGDGRVAYVVYDRVQMLTGGNGLRRAQVLALVIAHEIGHLLLPYNAHSHTGLMRADWTSAELHLAQRGLIFFTPEERILLRSRISASRHRVKP